MSRRCSRSWPPRGSTTTPASGSTARACPRKAGWGAGSSRYRPASSGLPSSPRRSTARATACGRRTRSRTSRTRWGEIRTTFRPSEKYFKRRSLKPIRRPIPAVQCDSDLEASMRLPLLVLLLVFPQERSAPRMEEVFRLAEMPVVGLDFSPDGSRLCFGGEGYVHELDVKSFKVVTRTDQRDLVDEVVFDPKGVFVVTRSKGEDTVIRRSKELEPVKFALD